MNSKLTSLLTHSYADLVALYLMMSGIHRNITGSNFYALHQMFGEFYEAVADEADRLGEYIRGGFGAVLPISFADLTPFVRVDFPAPTLGADGFIAAAIAAHEKLKEGLKQGYEEAETAKDCTASNILQDLMEAADHRLYLLRSHKASSGTAEPMPSP